MFLLIQYFCLDYALGNTVPIWSSLSLIAVCNGLGGERISRTIDEMQLSLNINFARFFFSPVLVNSNVICTCHDIRM